MVKNRKKVSVDERAVLSPVRTRRSFSQRTKEVKDCLQTDSSDNDVKSPPRKVRSVKVEDAESRETNRPRTRSLTLEVQVDRVSRSRKNNTSPRSRDRNLSRSVPARGKGGLKKNQSLVRTPDQGTVVRRSVRESRKVFDSLNEHNLVHTLVGDYSQSRRPSKRRQILDDTETDSQGEPSSYVSMYDIIKNKTKTDEDDDEEDDEEQEEDDDDEQNGEENSSEEEDDEEGDDDIPQQRYTLRKNKPITKRYTAPPLKACSSSHIRVRGSKEPFSPVRKSYKLKRKTINDSSTSSDDDDDNRRFERRKSKSMTKARNRCLPMNLGLEDVSKGILADRERVGSSLADVDPMNVDRSITFDSIGGLKKHIRSLKEMVVFPLLYPEIFEKFKVNPPRGVLFSGPPGTGKTLMARALANECSQEGKKVAFFMRKGADCLSKWVGESERQLRLLFDQAFKMRPSIIFFDEIDGLAPVRSSRQDQIHSSIVSTLLALMDGLDNRGEIVVIGATNRIDSIDPALRRPGRFDREFIFPLPDKNARRNILSIHTKAWQPKLTQMFINVVADRCVGYCGADLKALCTEATLFALRRRYPQIYASKKKLVLDINSVQVNGKDFAKAINTIIPACQRAVNSPGRALDSSITPLLHHILAKALAVLRTIFPASARKTVDEASPGGGMANAVVSDSESSDEDDDATEIYESDPKSRAARAARRAELRGPRAGHENAWHCFTDNMMTSKAVYRPRYLVCGRPGMGQSTHITPALLHSMEHLPVHCLDLPALFGCASKTPEEACSQIFREARRVAPSIIYLSRIELLWSTTTDTLKATFLALLNDLPPTTPLLIFATSDLPFSELSPELSAMFSTASESVYEVPNPSANDRWAYYEALLLNESLKMPCANKRQKAKKPLEVLAVAAPPVPRELSASELQKVREDEEDTLRELRIFLREITVKLMSDRKFKEFYKPVDLEEVPDYLEVIKSPMDLSTMLQKVDGHHYQTCADYLTDIDLITSNALEYNPNADTFDRLIRHRACALKDCAHSLIMSQLDPDFEKTCSDIAESRKNRGESKNICAPKFFPVAPVKKVSQDATGAGTASDSNQQLSGSPVATRMSRRVRGLNADIPVEIMSIERLSRVTKSAPSVDQSSTANRARRRMHYGSRRRRRNRRRDSPTPFRQDTPMKLIAEQEYSGPEFAGDNEELVHERVAGDSTEPEVYEMDEEKPRVVDLEEHISTSGVVVGLQNTENGTLKSEEKSPDVDTQAIQCEMSPVLKNLTSSVEMTEEKASKDVPEELEHDSIIENGLDTPSGHCSSTIDKLSVQSDNIMNSVCAINGIVNDDIVASIDKEGTHKIDSKEYESLSNSVQEKPTKNYEEKQGVDSPEKSKKVLFVDHDEIMEVTDNLQDEEGGEEMKASSEQRREFERLLYNIVKGTENKNVETLEQYYNNIKHCIIKHKKDETKQPLLNDLTSLVENISASQHY